MRFRHTAAAVVERDAIPCLEHFDEVIAARVKAIALQEAREAVSKFTAE